MQKTFSLWLKDYFSLVSGHQYISICSNLTTIHISNKHLITSMLW